MAKEIIISYALEAKRIAEDLIPQYHEEITDARLLYLFTTQKRKKCDRVRLGSAKKFSAMERFLSSRHFQDAKEPAIELGADFMVLFDSEEWGLMKQAQRIALVDHELYHCARFEKIVKDQLMSYYGLRSHDVEEFTAVIERHGLLWREQQVMAKVMQQQLPLEPVQR